MQQLIDFLGGYQPQYPALVRGFPRERVQALEDALGRPLPPAYRDFLETAAANLGYFVYEANFDIDEVIELCEDKAETLPPSLVPIAVDESTSWNDFFLDQSRSDREGDGMVVRSAAGSKSFDDVEPEARSLRDLLFFEGFRSVRMLTLPHREAVVWPLEDFGDPETAPARDQLDEFLDKLGLRKLDVTSDAAALYEGGDRAAMVFESMTFPTFGVMLATADPKAAARAAETICDAMRGEGERRPW